jgi:hypothetical protein
MGHKRTPREYTDCVWAAIRRMAIVLNASHQKDISMTWLKETDDQIRTRFQKPNLARLVECQLVRQVSGSGAPPKSEIDLAENGFYGTFNFTRPRKVGGGLRVGVSLTPTFLDWSYKRLFRPNGTDAALERATFADEDAFMKACATNYLLKNFWHNYVHNELQGLHEKNYWKFNGSLTYENDFEADNVATILLVRAYGLTIPTGGRPNSKVGSRVAAVLLRNRCNHVFVEREQVRRRHALSVALPNPSVSTQFMAYGENEWYLRRRIANAMSARLIEDGHVVTRLGVYLSGTPKLGRRGPYPTGRIVVQLNGWSLDTNMAPTVIDPLASDPNSVARKQRQSKLVDAVVGLAVTSYGGDMQANAHIRRHAALQIEALGARMGGVKL